MCEKCTRFQIFMEHNQLRLTPYERTNTCERRHLLRAELRLVNLVFIAKLCLRRA